MVKIKVRHFNNVSGVEDIWLVDSIKFDEEKNLTITLDGNDYKFTNDYINILEIDMVVL